MAVRARLTRAVPAAGLPSTGGTGGDAQVSHPPSRRRGPVAMQGTAGELETSQAEASLVRGDEVGTALRDWAGPVSALGALTILLPLICNNGP